MGLGEVCLRTAAGRKVRQGEQASERGRPGWVAPPKLGAQRVPVPRALPPPPPPPNPCLQNTQTHLHSAISAEEAEDISRCGTVCWKSCAFTCSGGGVGKYAFASGRVL